jgi:hypothetical protein
VSSLSAQLKAVVKEITGKVEIKPAEGAWRSAKAGVTLSQGYSISTGFDSTAVLEIGQSVLRVRALTRMRLEELLQKEGTVSTGLYLSVGKVKAEVKTVAGVPQKFMLKGPVSTAAVRGTDFEFDGFTVKVTNGVVVFINIAGQSRGVSAGEDSSTDGAQPPTSGDQEKDWRAQINPYTSPTETGPAGEPAAQMAHVTIRWQ